MGLLRGVRVRKGRVIGALLVVGLVGVAVQYALSLRPDLDVYAPVVVTEASAGTTYAVDEQLCVRGEGAVVREVRVAEQEDVTAELVLPPEDDPVVIAFPVDPDAGTSPEGAVVPEDDDLCLRLLVTGEEQGLLETPEVEVVVGYGPGGVLRRTFDVRPPVTLEVVRTGPDPRVAAAQD